MTHEPEVAPPAPEGPKPRAYPDPRERYVDDPRRKRELFAGVLALMPGLGHVYVGYYRQAFQNVLVICFAFLLLSSGAFDGVEPPIALFMAFYWLYNVVDAVRRASLYNQALVGLRAMDLPDDVPSPMPLRMGSLGGGILLVAVGLILFTHTMFNWSLRWVGDWWPMGLVADRCLADCGRPQGQTRRPASEDRRRTVARPRVPGGRQHAGPACRGFRNCHGSYRIVAVRSPPLIRPPAFSA